MLSKPSVFNRNDPVTRRDVQPVLGGARFSAPSASNATAAEKSGSTVAGSDQSAGKPLADAPAIPTLNETVDSRSAETASEARLIVGPEVKLKGAEILDCDTLVVEGRVEATMDSRVIRIAENGYFSGKVSIDVAEIHGAFDGELTARSQLIIHAGGRVSGTIRFGKLVVEEGGKLCGDVNMIGDKPLAPATMAANEPRTLLNEAKVG